MSLRRAARKFTKTLDSTAIVNGTVDNFGINGTLAGLTNGAQYDVTIDRVDSNGTLTASKEEVLTCTVSGDRFISCTRGVEGTAQAHSAGAVLEVRLTASQWNAVIDALTLDTDGTLAANSDTKIASQKAVKTYVGSNSGVVGEVKMYAGASAPAGHLLCDGSAVSRTTYAALFAVIGTTYGTGNGTTTFNLPNLKGKVIVGLDASQTEFDVLGETGGEKTHLLTGAESGEKGHNHTQNPHNHSYGINSGSTPGTAAGVSQNGSQGATTGSTTATNNAVAASDASQAHNNLQPYIVMNYIIKY